MEDALSGREGSSPPPLASVGGRLVTRREIVDAALVIAERVGVGRVTMRILADELGVSVATAYYHVEDKAELLRLMGDAALAQVACPPREAPWDQRLITLSADVRRMTARYPGLFPTVPGVLEGPEVERLSACTMEMLRDAGVPDDDLEAALLAVATYTWGQLLLDTLGREALPVDSPGSPGPTFEASFEFLLDGVRSRGRSARHQP